MYVNIVHMLLANVGELDKLQWTDDGQLLSISTMNGMMFFVHWCALVETKRKLLVSSTD